MGESNGWSWIGRAEYRWALLVCFHLLFLWLRCWIFLKLICYVCVKSSQTMFFVLKLGWWWCTGSTRLDCTAQLEGSALDLGWSQILRLLERERPLLHKLSPGPAVLLVTPRDILKTPNSGLTSSGDLSCVGGSCVQTGSAFFSSGAQNQNWKLFKNRVGGLIHIKENVANFAYF